MTQIHFYLLAGAIAGLLFIMIARRVWGPSGEMRIYALGLVIAALIYVGFYVVFAVRGAPLTDLGLEVVGLGTFATVAILRHTESNMILAGGWTGHAAWDLFLHAVPPTSLVPDWYPVSCIAFDLVVAGYIVVRLKQTEPLPRNED